MSDKVNIEELKTLEKAATKGPWKWTAAGGEPQIEGNVEYPEASPVLVARGCNNKRETSAGVHGCMPETLNDPLRACPLHPHAKDRELIVALRNAAPALFDTIELLREQLEAADHLANLSSAFANKLQEKHSENSRLREALQSLVHPTEAAKNYIDYGIGYAHTIGELISTSRKAYNAAQGGEELAQKVDAQKERDSLKEEMEQYKGFYESTLIRAREFQDERNALKEEVEQIQRECLDDLRRSRDFRLSADSEIKALRADLEAARKEAAAWTDAAMECSGRANTKIMNAEREIERLRSVLTWIKNNPGAGSLVVHDYIEATLRGEEPTRG